VERKASKHDVDSIESKRFPHATLMLDVLYEEGFCGLCGLCAWSLCAAGFRLPVHSTTLRETPCTCSNRLRSSKPRNPRSCYEVWTGHSATPSFLGRLYCTQQRRSCGRITSNTQILYCINLASCSRLQPVLRQRFGSCDISASPLHASLQYFVQKLRGSCHTIHRPRQAGNLPSLSFFLSFFLSFSLSLFLSVRPAQTHCRSLACYISFGEVIRNSHMFG
jgi:hypothetical protein